MEEITVVEHDMRDLVYRVRIKVVAEIVDRNDETVIASGDEELMKKLYRELKRRAS